MATSTSPDGVLARIGNFVGQKIREVLIIVDTKLNRTEFEAVKRFDYVDREADLATVQTVRINDIRIAKDTNRIFRLKDTPSYDLGNWEALVATSSDSAILREFQFTEMLNPSFAHNMGRKPKIVYVEDDQGVPMYCGHRHIDNNTIELFLTEAIAGRCCMVFQFSD